MLGVDGDHLDRSYIRNGVLGGFDIELANAVCARSGRTCAVLPVPWLSVWPSSQARFGWQGNPKHYPGEGFHDRWVHCVMSMWNIVPWQQSVAFTDPYSDKTRDFAYAPVPLCSPGLLSLRRALIWCGGDERMILEGAVDMRFAGGGGRLSPQKEGGLNQ